MTRHFNWRGLVAIAFVLALWQAITTAGLTDNDYLPSPSRVASTLFSRGFWQDVPSQLAHTLAITVAAAIIAIVLGAVVGIMIGLVRPLSVALVGTIDFFRTLPVTALVPVLLLIWGPEQKTELIAAAYAAFWPMVFNTWASVSTSAHRLDNVSKTLRLSRWRRVVSVQVPGAMPGMIVGARLAIVGSLILTVIAEMLINPAGLGWGLTQAQQALAPRTVWAYAVVIGAIGYLMNLLLIRSASLTTSGRAGLLDDVQE